MVFDKANNIEGGQMFRSLSKNCISAAGSALKILFIGAAVSAATPAMADVAMDSHEDDATELESGLGEADANFRAIFASWKKMDNVVHATVSIPSSKPVDNMMLTSSFGVRSDPFNGRRLGTVAVIEAPFVGLRTAGNTPEDVLFYDYRQLRFPD